MNLKAIQIRENSEDDLDIEELTINLNNFIHGDANVEIAYIDFLRKTVPTFHVKGFGVQICLFFVFKSLCTSFILIVFMYRILHSK